jgi:hypothetical protein
VGPAPFVPGADNIGIIISEDALLQTHVIEGLALALEKKKPVVARPGGPSNAHGLRDPARGHSFDTPFATISNPNSQCHPAPP